MTGFLPAAEVNLNIHLFFFFTYIERYEQVIKAPNKVIIQGNYSHFHTNVVETH